MIGWEIYGRGGRPKHLAPTERRYYQLWRLILLPEHQWPAALTSYTIKQIYLMREMCFIPLAIGPDAPSPLIEANWYLADGRPRCCPLFETYNRDSRRGALGTLLQERIGEHEKRMRTLDTGDVYWLEDYPWMLTEYSKLEAFAGFHSI